jgi:hypothetical protein
VTGYSKRNGLTRDVQTWSLADNGSNMPMKIIGKPTSILPIYTASRRHVTANCNLKNNRRPLRLFKLSKNTAAVLGAQGAPVTPAHIFSQVTPASPRHWVNIWRRFERIVSPSSSCKRNDSNCGDGKIATSEAAALRYSETFQTTYIFRNSSIYR